MCPSDSNYCIACSIIIIIVVIIIIFSAQFSPFATRRFCTRAVCCPLAVATSPRRSNKTWSWKWRGWSRFSWRRSGLRRWSVCVCCTMPSTMAAGAVFGSRCVCVVLCMILFAQQRSGIGLGYEMHVHKYVHNDRKCKMECWCLWKICRRMATTVARSCRSGKCCSRWVPTEPSGSMHTLSSAFFWVVDFKTIFLCRCCNTFCRGKTWTSYCEKPRMSVYTFSLLFNNASCNDFRCFSVDDSIFAWLTLFFQFLFLVERSGLRGVGAPVRNMHTRDPETAAVSVCGQLRADRHWRVN